MPSVTARIARAAPPPEWLSARPQEHAREHRDQNKKKPGAAGEELAGADQVLPKNGDGRPACGRKAKGGRLPFLGLLMACQLPERMAATRSANLRDNSTEASSKATLDRMTQQ